MLGVFAAIVWSDPDAYWPLDLDQPPGLFTQWRIRLLADEPLACQRTLARADIAASLAPERPQRNGCGYDDAVVLSGGALAETPAMRCATAAAYALWLRHVVQPAAERRLGARVARVRTFGAFSCRDIAGRPGRRSQHATANAIDVSGFELADGRTVTLSRDWNKGEPGRFLREVRDGACGLFAGVLSPDWNAAHADHFHLDLGRAQICR
ncbi:extensin family protein [Chenggangzhangella methanolivorans]|uniref:extensin-like domain-containing protein n=1 Tax=Chenggangzhangella methanolivorans TaxID=1437009 RepID=UPI0021BD06B1|nr:extensin family protein [Chenggangzhangella methanolivorans]